MRLALRLLRPAPNQNVTSPKLWQDPLLGYFETHGKMEFVAGEQYNLTDAEKKAVLWRYRVKEILKKEYMRRDFNPHTYKYKHGVIVDPAMYRWYAAEMNPIENFRVTPRTCFIYFICTFFAIYVYFRLCMENPEWTNQECMDGEMLWWDRQDGRIITTSGSGLVLLNPGWRMTR
ncbi:NADH-ubiquinone oxidoreductase b15 subunit (NDUFB4) domain-containing protein [Ditylenchus destructor]|uniref:NADH dehydrogenase [ubiquinone] 1 beta subcomplex subunit 4 n=1 Tax=Ditylenchus destructor TaxID=166010 RepID=A0AAD4ND64_9BILA|nr:NADH-ubiquinone oxidoreductase b15 subunit (NDUFB4) domain-containing protein [Ditylenchus destructor]